MRGGYLMSGRVGALKWLGALQLIHGILLFILTLVYFAIDFDENSDNSGAQMPAYLNHIHFTMPTILLAIGAGVAGASMSRYQGLIHNISGKSTGVALSTMNGISAILTMVYSGSLIFYRVDKGDVLDDDGTKDWEKAVVALIIINFVLAFFDMLVAFMFVTLAVLWMPNESNIEKVPSLPPRGRPVEYVREPEPEIRDYYRSSDRYNVGGYGNGYYGGADPYYGGYGGPYRSLPAIKY